MPYPYGVRPVGTFQLSVTVGLVVVVTVNKLVPFSAGFKTGDMGGAILVVGKVDVA